MEITKANGNINGKIKTGADIEKRIKHVYADTKICETYFKNCELYEDGYVRDEMNIHINSPIYSYSNIELNGNVALNSNMGTLMNINVNGEVKNANTSIVYAKYGNITIENNRTANINGLIYCPLGTLTIDSPNINLNGVIIADKIVINGSSININYKDDIASFIGTESEKYDFSDLEYLPESWLGDTDEDELFDIYEKVIDTEIDNPDTDGDRLPEGYEVLTLNTDPLEIDTDGNGILDGDEDFDNDNLNNLGEYQNKTGPYNSDTDEDGLLDGDEVHTYLTDPMNPDTDNDKLLDGEEGFDGEIYKKYGVYFDPLNPDTNGNGILDGAEVFGQSKKQTVSTNDEAITEIKVDMNTSGSLERNLTIESMYGIDAMSSNVYAMIGEPFNFTSETDFDFATITFQINKSKLGDSKFDNLIILWYNEEEQVFEEMPTTRSWENSTVSTTTTHFSQYLIVDSEKWYDNWEESFNELRKMWVAGTSYKRNLNTIYLVDCSSGMSSSDKCGPSLVVGYNGVTEENIEEIRYSINSQWDVDYYCVNWCKRAEICYNILKNKGVEDNSAIIGFSDTIVFNSGYTKDKEHLKNAIPKIHNGNGTAYLNTALNAALSYVQENTTDLYRLIVITNNNITFNSISSDDFSDNVILNIVNMDSGAIGYGIKDVVHETHGDVYNVASAEELTYESGGFVASPEKFIGKDSDGDGIPDLVELYGLKPNGQPINTNPYSRDTDGDGLDDNVELNYIGSGITSNVTMAEYVRAILYNTDPAKADTDGDGLNDNQNVYYNGKVLVPVDPNPTKYDGPKGVWNAQRRLALTGNIPVNYAESTQDFNEFMEYLGTDYADDLVDILLENPWLANETAINFLENSFKDFASGRDAAKAGADFLDFILDEQGTVYHSQVSNWQRDFGYNDLYDKVFQYGSNMQRNKITFVYNGNKYILWSWKGDYWNLESGAETGLYVYDRTVNGNDQYDVVDFELPMTLSLFNSYGDRVENVFSWVPNQKQWWITGFNPNYTEPNPEIMTIINSVDFSENEGMYYALRESYMNTNPVETNFSEMIFDDEYKTVWIVW